ncbi:MAG: hypothetical protein ABJ239_03700 [Erythrobacter sp.]
MSKLINQEFIADNARIVEAPCVPTKVDRSFEMPSVLYGTTVALYLGFLAIMAATFASPGLIIPLAICALFVFGGFGVPMVWTRLAPETKQRALSWGEFSNKGIMTNTGRLSPRDAAIQMLILPVLIVFWGLAVATIAALV